MKQVFRSKVLMASVLAAGLAAAVFAQGRPGPDGPGGRRHGMMGPGLPLAQLNLTEAQQGQVRDVMQRHRDELQTTMKQVAAAHEAQRKAIETVPLNEGLVRSTSEALGNAEAEAAVQQARIHSDVFAVLTPEQQAKARQIESQRETEMSKRMQQFQNHQGRRQKPAA